MSEVTDFPDGVRLIRSRFATYHGIPRSGGAYTICSRSQSTCKYCRMFGVPLNPPDPFDETFKYISKYANEKWFSLYRTPRSDGEDLMDGVAIYVRVDGKTIVIANFGDHPELELIVAAIVFQHNLEKGWE